MLLKPRVGKCSKCQGMIYNDHPSSQCTVCGEALPKEILDALASEKTKPMQSASNSSRSKSHYPVTQAIVNVLRVIGFAGLIVLSVVGFMSLDTLTVALLCFSAAIMWCLFCLAAAEGYQILIDMEAHQREIAEAIKEFLRHVENKREA